MSNSNNKTPVIRKSNELITARYKLSVIEQRLVLLLASSISPNDEDFKDYEIRISDFIKMFGLESDKSIYQKLEQAAESLLNQIIILQDNETKEVTHWLSYIKYIKGSGVINLDFHKSLKPYFLQLKSHFTQYDSKYVINFKSQYSIRIYELLKMEAYKEKNGYFEKTFEVHELRLLLDVDKKDYSLFSNFKNRIIEPAIKEISDKTDLYINSVLYGKTGRKITNITFSVSTKDETTKQKISPENEGKNHPIIETLVSLGFSLDIAKRYKNKHGIKKIERNISYTLKKKQEGIAKDIPAYLNKAIENDYGAAWDIENQKQAESKKQQAKLEQVKKTDTEKATQDKKARFQKAFNDFLLLPENQQDELKQEFFEKSDLTVTGKIKDAQRKGIDIFTSPLVASPFKVFLMERGF